MSRKNKNRDNGFAEWGGYMEAKKAKLDEQYKENACNQTKKSDIFKGVAILVNGYTTPSADELKCLMAAHGGVYHLYQSSGTTGATTHIIASNLPNVKIKQLGSVPVVKPTWITESIASEKRLDYKKYLLYTNLDRKQPILDFPVITKPPTNGTKSNDVNTDAELDPNLNLIVDDSKIITIPTKHVLEPKHQSSKALTAADPRFLAEFYNNSRLHLISTLGAEFKQLVCQLREKSDGKFPGKLKLMQMNGNAIVSNEAVVMHIDMDCFFVSVSLRNRPELRGQPVAVTHARNSQTVNRSEPNAEAEFALLKKYFPEDRIEKLDAHASMSEIASCSYEARKCGVRNGMFLGSALKLCQNLQTIPYDFQGYREVSTILYNTIAAYTLDIEAVSCDEMYVDVAPLLREAAITVEQWATHLRKEIMNATGCPCSTGFGANRLQARLATKNAKPAGQFHLKQQDVEEYMAKVPLADLPGVGHATLAKLSGLELKTCGDVHAMSLSRLQAELGHKAGKTLLEQTRGIDHKPLNFQHERKSVSADVNYGIRFKDKTEALNFLQSLSMEVYTRLRDIGLRARCLTLKLLVRAPEAPQETAKFLGCGICNAINRSTTTGGLINDVATIYREAKTLYERANVPPAELRGVGIQLTKLEKVPPVNSALTRFLQQNCDKKGEISNKNNCVEVLEKKTVLLADVDKQIEDINKDLILNKIHSNQPIIHITVDSQNKPSTVTSKCLEDSPAKRRTNESSKKQTKTTVKTKSGNRGPPKGVITNKSTKKLVNGLNKYFKPQKTTTSPELGNANANNIDLNVLNKLPKELRQEIIKEFRLEDKVTPKSPPKNHCGKKAKDDEEPLESSRVSKPSVFHNLDLEELKPIIINWLNSEKEPVEVDIMMIAEYFKQLAVDRKIEVLKKMLSFLYRHITKLGLCSWHEAYWTIINTVQEGMVARYGSTLHVERHFVCSIHS